MNSRRVFRACLFVGIYVTAASAFSSQITLNMPLSDVDVSSDVIQVEKLTGAYVQVAGNFNVPAIDPEQFSLQGVSFALNTTIGGGGWLSFSNTLLVGLRSSVVISGPRPYQDVRTQSVGFAASAASFTLYDSTPIGTVPNVGLFISEDPQDYVPVGITLRSDVSASNFGELPLSPGALAYVVFPFLEVTYDFELVGSASLLDFPTGATASISAAASQFDEGNPPPSGLFPLYVVPEPSPLLLATSASLALLIASTKCVRRRRQP